MTPPDGLTLERFCEAVRRVEFWNGFWIDGSSVPVTPLSVEPIKSFLADHPGAHVCLPTYFAECWILCNIMVVDQQGREIARIDYNRLSLCNETFAPQILIPIEPGARVQLFDARIDKPGGLEITRRLGLAPFILERMERFAAGQLLPPDPSEPDNKKPPKPDWIWDLLDGG